MFDFLSHWRFSLLLAALTLNILLVPLFISLDVGSTLHIDLLTGQIAFTILLVIVVLAAGHNKILICAYVILALAALIFSWVNINTNSSEISFYRNLFSFAALTVAMILVMKEVFTNDSVTIDTISGALCAYLLLGLTFSSVYAFIDIIEPGSFLSIHDNRTVALSTHTNVNASLERIYFSFITLLTVGYGDIVPYSPAAKLFTIIEGFFGQVYLVVMIARLVGMHVSQRMN